MAKTAKFLPSDLVSKSKVVFKQQVNYVQSSLNWAKSIPLYLTSGFVYKAKALMSDKIVLINGGFREDAQVEIWLVPKDGELPKPTPTIAEADIKFRDDKPSSVPNFTNCY